MIGRNIMSERGSFITEYVYCDKCFRVVKKYLLMNNKYLCSTIIPSWEEGKVLPIVAGKIGGSYSGEELNVFVYRIQPCLEKEICHKLRIVVLAENGQEIFTILPNKENLDVK